ncbi:MAG: phage holin family protein [Candidatus Eremiobacteraeota bacterium]|nr:phage holin family protein [Candidatus Eremiobacteraeota bacterium]
MTTKAQTAKTTKGTTKDESFPETLKQLAEDLSVMVRNDLEAARTEMLDKVKTAGVGAGMLSGSAVTAALTMFSLTILGMVGLSAIMKPWIAVLVVTLFWAAATAVLALMGKDKLREAGPPIPTQTIEQVKEDIQTAKEEIAAAR